MVNLADLCKKREASQLLSPRPGGGSPSASGDTRLALRKRTATAWCGPLWEPTAAPPCPSHKPGHPLSQSQVRPAGRLPGPMEPCAVRPVWSAQASHRQDGLDTAKDRTNSSTGRQAGNRGQDLGRTALQVTIPAS